MCIVDEAGQRFAHKIGFLIAEEPLRCLITAFDDAVRRGHQHSVAQAVEHGIQVIFGDRSLGEVLPHPLERVLQLSELVAAHYGQRPSVITLSDTVRRLDQCRDRS